MTAPDRIELLLAWLNHDQIPDYDDPAAVREKLQAFVESFDGSESAGHVKQVYDGSREGKGRSFFDTRRVSDDERVEEATALYDLHSTLLDILRKGFPAGPDFPKATSWQTEFTTLHFSASAVARREPGKLHPQASKKELAAMSKTEKAAYKRAVAAERQKRQADKAVYLSPGAYTLVVDGALRDLVPFLLLHLLTLPGMSLISRCPAPAPNDWGSRCGNFLLRGTERGRPREFCSGACRVRAFAEKMPDQQGRKIQRRARRK